MSLIFNTFSDFLGLYFPGKVRKIPVHAGLGCPNRDGTLGSNGCIYCSNAAFNPSYAHDSQGSITQQLRVGIDFASHKGPFYGYLAYFQSYTNTYGDTQKLISLYEEALDYPGVVGLVIATRPDCIKPELADWLERRFGKLAPENHPFLLMEIGVESTLDSTLERIGRGHTFDCARKTITDLANRGISVGVHIILGLPGETHQDYMTHADRISDLPVSTLKLHQLQIVRGTSLERMYNSNPQSIHLFTPQEYAMVVNEFVRRARHNIYYDRFVSETPYNLLVAPRWGIKPDAFQLICKNMPNSFADINGDCNFVRENKTEL